MSLNQRNLRSSKTASSPAHPIRRPPPTIFKEANASPSANDSIRILPPGSMLPGLSRAELSLLHRKQRQIRYSAAATIFPLQPATLIFAQHEAGTAVCIDPAGWLLTCAHCIADDHAEWMVTENRLKWLLCHTGVAVQIECRAWDPQRDLALLKIIAMEASMSSPSPPLPSGTLVPVFPSVQFASEPPIMGEEIICIGQPGRDDLEVEGNRGTNYQLFEVSKGAFHGMVPGLDPQDNSQIGTMKHDAWTYWGHSGAPLLRAAGGTLVGLHSSWDAETGMRHGIPWVAIREFLMDSPAGDTKELWVRNGDFGLANASEAKPTRSYGNADIDGDGSSSVRSNPDVIDLTGSSP